MIPNFDSLGEMTRNIYISLSQLFFIALPVGILVSIVIGYLKSGSNDYVDVLRRALVASILIISFPEISNWILSICDGIALKIDNQSGIETILRLAEEKSRHYSVAKSAILLKFDDLVIAILSFLSFIVLFLARYLTIALYYFFWVFLSVMSPIFIFFYLFPSTSNITKNLYKGLIEVAAWKIVWAVQSAMLMSLSLGDVYKVDGNYITLVVLNFVIAIGMLSTPKIVKAITGDGAHGMAHAIGASAFSAMTPIPGKTLALKKKIQGVSKAVGSQVSQKYQSYQTQKADKRNNLRY